METPCIVHALNSPDFRWPDVHEARWLDPVPTRGAPPLVPGIQLSLPLPLFVTTSLYSQISGYQDVEPQHYLKPESLRQWGPVPRGDGRFGVAARSITDFIATLPFQQWRTTLEQFEVLGLFSSIDDARYPSLLALYDRHTSLAAIHHYCETTTVMSSAYEVIVQILQSIDDSLALAVALLRYALVRAIDAAAALCGLEYPRYPPQPHLHGVFATRSDLKGPSEVLDYLTDLERHGIPFHVVSKCSTKRGQDVRSLSNANSSRVAIFKKGLSISRESPSRFQLPHPGTSEWGFLVDSVCRVFETASTDPNVVSVFNQAMTTAMGAAVWSGARYEDNPRLLPAVGLPWRERRGSLTSIKRVDVLSAAFLVPDLYRPRRLVTEGIRPTMAAKSWWVLRASLDSVDKVTCWEGFKANSAIIGYSISDVEGRLLLKDSSAIENLLVTMKRTFWRSDSSLVANDEEICITEYSWLRDPFYSAALYSFPMPASTHRELSKLGPLLDSPLDLAKSLSTLLFKTATVTGWPLIQNQQDQPAPPPLDQYSVSFEVFTHVAFHAMNIDVFLSEDVVKLFQHWVIVLQAIICHQLRSKRTLLIPIYTDEGIEILRVFAHIFSQLTNPSDMAMRLSGQRSGIKSEHPHSHFIIVDQKHNKVEVYFKWSDCPKGSPYVILSPSEAKREEGRRESLLAALTAQSVSEVALRGPNPTSRREKRKQGPTSIPGGPAKSNKTAGDSDSVFFHYEALTSFNLSKP